MRCGIGSAIVKHVYGVAPELFSMHSVANYNSFRSALQYLARFSQCQALLERVFADGSRLRELLPGVRPEQQHARNYETWNLLTLGLWLDGHAIAV